MREGSTVVQFSEAKKRLSDVYDRVGRTGIQVISRRRDQPVVLTTHRELSELLAEHFPFTTRTSRGGDGTVSIWLDEFAVYGRGGTIAEAVDDLLDEVEAYLDEWEERLHATPNHREVAWWVHRAQLARDRDELRDVVFDAPPGDRAAR